MQERFFLLDVANLKIGVIAVWSGPQQQHVEDEVIDHAVAWTASRLCES